MAKGWITLERDIVDHWLWEEEPFSKAQAWVDLLLHANHKPARINIKGRVLTLNIGQQARSEVTLTKTWKWSRNKVRRFLKQLKTEQMIEQQTIQQTSVITICKYKDYQERFKQGDTGGGTAGETGGGTGTGQGRDRGRNTEEQCNHENHENHTKQIPSESADAEPDPPAEKPKSKYKFTTHHEELAVRMSNPVKCRFPSQKINLDEWADCVRKLQEIDKHPRQEIIDLWQWIINHETQSGSFSGWADNCRSPMKLRQRKDGLSYFEIIRTQMRREQAKQNPQSRTLEDQLNDRSWAEAPQSTEPQGYLSNG